MRKVVLLGPRLGWKPGSRTIENSLPSMARWKVSATTRAVRRRPSVAAVPTARNRLRDAEFLPNLQAVKESGFE